MKISKSKKTVQAATNPSAIPAAPLLDEEMIDSSVDPTLAENAEELDSTSDCCDTTDCYAEARDYIRSAIDCLSHIDGAENCDITKDSIANLSVVLFDLM